MKSPASKYSCNANQIWPQQSITNRKYYYETYVMKLIIFQKHCTQPNFHELISSVKVVWHHFILVQLSSVL